MTALAINSAQSRPACCHGCRLFGCTSEADVWLDTIVGTIWLVCTEAEERGDSVDGSHEFGSRLKSSWRDRQPTYIRKPQHKTQTQHITSTSTSPHCIVKARPTRRLSSTSPHCKSPPDGFLSSSSTTATAYSRLVD